MKIINYSIKNYIMEQQLLLKLHNLVNNGVFNKSVQDFGPNIEDLDQLERKRIYFIRVRQPGQKGIDAIAMYNNTYTHLNMVDSMSFRQYYVRNLRMSEDDPYNPLKQLDISINISIQPDLYILDITDIIINKSRELDKLNVAHLSSNQVGPNLISKLPYGIVPNNGQETGTGEGGIIASYLGGKSRWKNVRNQKQNQSVKNERKDVIVIIKQRNNSKIIYI